MIKIVLADDEPVIIKGIQKLVDWNSLGVQVVGEYQDGKTALDGILALKPDIALLDINMPRMTGIEILKELTRMNSRTRVIFISGFQDFQYAKDALRYGAADYLLKPVIREELLSSMEKCCEDLQKEWDGRESQGKSLQTESDTPYDRLMDMEETTYLPVLLEILWEGDETRQERKLVNFSVLSYVEQYLEERGKGIVFAKNRKLVIILKGMDRRVAKEFVWEMVSELRKCRRHRTGAVIGPEADSMSRIPESYQKCLEWRGYLFFEDQIKVPVLLSQEPVFLKSVGREEFEECRRQLLEALVAQDRDGFEKVLKTFVRDLCIRSEGKKEDACYHFCTTIRMVGEKVKELGVKDLSYDVKDILEQGRETENYRQMSRFYSSYLEQYLEQVKASVIRSDKKDIIRAKEYIEAHYRENLTLEVLASQIHMNAFYFSSFFKKNSGENFKDYVNKVRLKHAMSLLVSTDKRTYEIADEVGFRDARAFSELFQRVYGETPASYRKRVRGK